jgi:hypothetical protein
VADDDHRAAPLPAEGASDAQAFSPGPPRPAPRSARRNSGGDLDLAGFVRSLLGGAARRKIAAGHFLFDTVLEEEKAPRTCAAFRRVMPFSGRIVHVRWSGEGVWIPLGDTDFGVGSENHTSYPSVGQIVLHPSGNRETELLLAHGGISFASRMGQLAGNHFIPLTSNLDTLMDLGNSVLWKGAHDVRFEVA